MCWVIEYGNVRCKVWLISKQRHYELSKRREHKCRVATSRVRRPELFETPLWKRKIYQVCAFLPVMCIVCGVRVGVGGSMFGGVTRRKIVTCIKTTYMREIFCLRIL